MGYALLTPSGHIHDYPYWRRAKIVYSRIDGSWRKVMVRGDFERAVRDRACDFTRVRWVRYSGVGSVGGVSEFSIEPVRRTGNAGTPEGAGGRDRRRGLDERGGSCLSALRDVW